MKSSEARRVTPGTTMVVGGSGGLGAAIAEAVTTEDRALYLTYRTAQEACETLAARLSREGARAAAGRMDLADGNSVAAALDAASALGPLDTLIYAAGPAIPQIWFSAVDPKEWRTHVATEIDGFFTLAHLSLPRLRAAGRSSLVAVTSFATTQVIPGDVLSAVPKAAIEMLVRQIAREEGRYGVRANCVAPGIIDAGLGLKAQQDHYTPELWAERRRTVPLRDFGSAGAIAEAVAYLASERAGYVTGQTIIVDGGLSL